MQFSIDFEVVTATSVAQARTYALDTFDMAIVDWHLPGENGMELATELRRYLPMGRVLLYTADDVADAHENDTWMRVAKSTPPEQLQHIVSAQLRRKRIVPTKEWDRVTKAGDANRPRLLIVDDEMDQCTVLTALFEGAMEVVSATSVSEAIEKYDLNTFDAAIVDWHLPGESGMMLAREMRRYLPAECIFLHTADQEAGSYQRGNWVYLAKSTGPEALERQVTLAVATLRDRRDK